MIATIYISPTVYDNSVHKSLSDCLLHDFLSIFLHWESMKQWLRSDFPESCCNVTIAILQSIPNNRSYPDSLIKIGVKFTAMHVNTVALWVLFVT